jgi:hypothetical protein
LKDLPLKVESLSILVTGNMSTVEVPVHVLYPRSSCGPTQLVTCAW